jgi:hypothetical protein
MANAKPVHTTKSEDGDKAEADIVIMPDVVEEVVEDVTEEVVPEVELADNQTRMGTCIRTNH